MQNAFVARGGAMEIPYAREIVPAINRLAHAFRSAGGVVCWIRTSLRDQERSWSVWFSGKLSPVAGFAAISSLSPGSPSYELFPELAVQDADMFVIKTRFSPFVQGASCLHRELIRLGVDAVAITGTVSNTCCESTARDAMMLNYRTIFVSDANAARTDEEHNATLGNMVQTFADVVSTEELERAVVHSSWSPAQG
ncbi:Isochorismatase family protein YecD [compost metagenome]